MSFHVNFPNFTLWVPLGPFGLEANRWKKGQKDGTHHVAAEKPESIDKESRRLSAGQAGKPHEFEIVQYVMICYEMLCLFMFLIGDLEYFLFSHILGILSSQLTNSMIFQRGRSTTNQL